MQKLSNKSYYPTPDKLIWKMWSKVKTDKVKLVLEPSAGQGNIINFVHARNGWGQNYEISCIEIDPDFQKILRGLVSDGGSKKCTVIDSDFLGYSGVDRFDLIIANPPFDDGASHLLKAIDIMFSGQIVFLLNAETLRNPYTNERKFLAKRLDELGADIEYIKDAFIDAERRTAVEVALVYINIERDLETTLVEGLTEATDKYVEIETETGIVSGNTINGKVEMFGDAVRAGMEVIKSYYTHRRKFGDLITIYTDGERDRRFRSSDSEASAVINNYVCRLRKQYWNDILTLDELKSRMTKKRMEEFHAKMEEYSYMDFTASNIRQLVLNVIGSYEDTMTEAVAEIFDRMSAKHHWSDEKSDNVHYFNGWKTNKSWYVNSRIVLPVPASVYSKAFVGWSGELRLDGDTERWLDDIDKVMNYFDPDNEIMYISKAIKDAFAGYYRFGSKIESAYFEIRVYLKGTIHLKFKSEDIRRRFNLTACKHKRWIFDDYGSKKYADMTAEEKRVVEEFEGSAKYKVNMGQIGFAKKSDVGLIA